MTPAELKSARQALGLSAEGFARMVRVESGRTVRRWESGERDIPGPVIVIVELAKDCPQARKRLLSREQGRNEKGLGDEAKPLKPLRYRYTEGDSRDHFGDANEMAAGVGLEPTTARLTVGRSTR